MLLDDVHSGITFLCGKDTHQILSLKMEVPLNPGAYQVVRRGVFSDKNLA